MKVRLLAVLLALCMTIGFLPSVASAQQTSQTVSTVNLADVAAQPAADASVAADPLAPEAASATAPLAAPVAELPAWPPAVALPVPVPPPAPKGVLAAFAEDLSHPLTPTQKFRRAFRETLFPGIFVAMGAAGLSMATDSKIDRDYNMGFAGFYRRAGASWAQDATSLFVGDWMIASALHLDPRYHPSTRAGFGHRLGHVISRVFVTSTDSGGTAFNTSGILGAAIGASVGQGVHHTSDQRGEYYAERFGYALLATGGFNLVKEFFFYRHAPRQ
jgi:hypothetical protein